MKRELITCLLVITTNFDYMKGIPVLSKLCEHFSDSPNCRNDTVNTMPKIQSSSFDGTTNSRNLTSPIATVALADPKPIPAMNPVPSTSDIFSEAQRKLDGRPKTSLESADTVFSSCDYAALVFGYYCGDDPETPSLKDKCQSYSQRCNVSAKPILKRPECEKDFNQYFFACTHNALPSLENQQYCENYWTFCRYMLEQKLGIQDASIYRSGRKYYANTFCQRYKLMGTLYCPTLQTTSLRQDCNFYRMYCRGQNATVQNLTYADNFPLATFLNPYHTPDVVNSSVGLLSPKQYADKKSLEYGYTGWNAGIAGITGYSGKTNVLLDGVANPVRSFDQDAGSSPFDVTNSKSLYEIPVAYTNFFMPWLNDSTATAQNRSRTIFRT